MEAVGFLRQCGRSGTTATRLALRRTSMSGLLSFQLSCSLLMLLLLIVDAESARVDIRKVNGSRAASTGLFWSSAVDEADLLRKSEFYEDPAEFGVDDIDAGFSTIDGMLQWAIGHSDPDKLNQTARDIQRMSAEDLENRRVQIKELMENLKTPSEAELMQIAINDLNNVSISLGDRKRALEELLILVEPIDNANDLSKLGGLVAVIQQLAHPDPDIRSLSAWVIGKASQNNPVVQKQVLDLGALRMLMSMVKSECVEEAVKALYAVSALIRNNFEGQELFYAETGISLLEDILSNSSVDIRLCRKAIFLVADLAESLLENMHAKKTPLSSKHFLKSVVNVATSTDLDLQEKVLVAIKSLLLLDSTEANAFKDFCGLEDALENLRQQLLKVMDDEERRSFVIDLENLRAEVAMIYVKKLQKGTSP